MLGLIAGVSLCAWITSLCVVYVYGFNKGLSFLKSPHATPAMPMIKAFGKKERRTPKFVSDEEQWKREQKQAPADPA